MIDRQIFTFAKGFLSDPSVLPAWGPRVEDYPEPRHPVMEMPEESPGENRYCVKPPTSKQWWEKEVNWMTGRRPSDTVVTDPSHPFHEAADLRPPLNHEGRAYVASTRLRQWAAPLTEGKTEPYTGTGPTSRSKETYEYEPGLSVDLATAADTDYPIAWMFAWAQQWFSEHPNNSKRRIMDVRTAPLQVYSDMWAAQAWAVREAYEAKWDHCWARPEEVFARTKRRLMMLYPNGAPFAPSYPSAWAAGAGAAACVLIDALNDWELKTPQARQVVRLAEAVALGRWVAGINWVCDGVAGLDMGWGMAADLIVRVNIASPWRKIAGGWN